MPLQLIQVIDQGATLMAVAQIKDIVTIYGVAIDLGYQVIEGTDLYIVNASEVESGESKVALVKSKSSKLKIYYRSTLPGQEPANTADK